MDWSEQDAWYERLLQDKYGATQLDYSVLAVAVMTLGLIMVVEVGKHRIEHAAQGRPFFQAVLHGLYEELSTLGIVEFFIWLLESYYTDLNKASKSVFAKVHFALFYTAIFNAFQSCIVAIAASRVSRRLWVETETLELNHYVEIREEFQRVNQQLEAHKKRTKEESSTEGEDALADRHDDEFEWTVAGFRRLGRSLVNLIQHPRLQRKYHRLLVQVRFHELRVHFLQSYQLPLKLKISDYLMRSELAVLIRLVHVSTVAWLLLTGATNLLYFITGVVAYEVENHDIVGPVLVGIFFVSMFAFVLIAVILRAKMRSIFRSIMQQEVLWGPLQDEAKPAEDQQLDLFWFSDPKFVIAAIQFMQFGYAVYLSIVIIFLDTINEGPIGVQWYLLALALSYSVFVYVVAKIIPRYTLCTSLGQLVDQKRLHETVAAFRLEEAKREQYEKLELQKVFGSKRDRAPMGAVLVRRPKSPAFIPSTSVTAASIGRTDSSVASERDVSELMADLVKQDTNSLRASLPESELLRLDQRQSSRRLRRHKAVSDGVGAMASFRRSSQSYVPDRPTHVRDDSSLGKGKSQDTNVLTHVGRDELKPEDTEREQLRARRRSRGTRMKSVSDGVAFMAALNEAESKESEEESFSRVNATDTSSSEVTFRPLGLAGSIQEEDREAAYVPQSLRSFVASAGEKLESATRDMLLSVGVTSNGNRKASADDEVSISGHSDADDVPGIDLAALQHLAEKPKRSVVERLGEYYLSRRFILLSNVFGTMIAFFMVGERVDSFLTTQGIINENEFAAISIPGYVSFWLLLVWLSLFLVTSLLIFVSVGSFSQLRSNRERTVHIGAALDTVLTMFTLAVLCIAEANRCCEADSATADSSETDVSGPAKNISVVLEDYGYFVPEPAGAGCSCPGFGFRQYGGLGMIEPFTALIALRVFRHWAAKRIVVYLESSFVPVLKKDDDRRSDIADAFDVFDDDSAHQHGEGQSMKNEKGTIVELWQSAVTKYPHIVAKHGEFSSELLRAMLDLPIPSDSGKAEPHTKDASHDFPTPAPAPLDELSLPDEYKELPRNVQEIIMAGKVGQSVRVVGRPSAVLSQSFNHSIPEETSEDFIFPRNVHFEITGEAIQSTGIYSAFTCPNARLVRSMRRCDKKLLPILDSWHAVDVVFTRHEMVYFDAVDVDGTNIDSQTDDTRQALVATRGGKGLRLCDVAVGRRVVGQLPLADIESIHVERAMPHPHGAGDRDGPMVDVHKTEYWGHRDDAPDFDRGSHWCLTNQDVLKIRTVHGGILCLRFYSDLEDAEAHPDRVAAENEEEGGLFKDNALHWAQTIVRVCGPSQLKQPLLHFGEDTSEELRDVLVVKKEQEPRHHRRRSSADIHMPRIFRPSLRRSTSAPNDGAEASNKPATGMDAV